MSAVESRVPEWREYPGAVSEAVFYVSSPESDAGPDGKYKYGGCPMSDDETVADVYVKGDYVPDFDYAGFSAELFTELRSVLGNGLDIDTYDEGQFLLRFVAFNRKSDWTLEGREEVLDLLEAVPLQTLAVGDEESASDDESESAAAETAQSDAGEREAMLDELAALDQLHGDVTPDLIREHSPRPADEYAAMFGSLDAAIDAYQED